MYKVYILPSPCQRFNNKFFMLLFDTLLIETLTNAQAIFCDLYDNLWTTQTNKALINYLKLLKY